MILEFSVENFGSIREEVVLSFEPDLGIEDGTDWPLGARTVLPVVALFGANGAGKSTLIRALSVLRAIVVSERIAEEDIECTPHKLDASYAQRPTILQIRVAHLGDEFHYRVSVVGGAIVEETLTQGGAPTTEGASVVLRRTAGETIEVGPEADVELLRKRLHRTISLVRVAATQNHRAAHALVSALFRIFVTLEPRGDSLKSVERRVATLPLSTQLHPFVTSADVGISNIFLSGDSLRLTHRGADASTVDFPIEEESAGTQMLLRWSPIVASTLAHGGLFAADELGAHLHHWMLRDLVETFQNPATNPRGAQLLVTTHDPLFFDTTLLRTDEMVLVEKNPEGATRLAAVSDFTDLPEDEPLVRSYLTGALGGIPRAKGLWAHLSPAAGGPTQTGDL
jgi:hypothetical protein